MVEAAVFNWQAANVFYIQLICALPIYGLALCQLWSIKFPNSVASFPFQFAIFFTLPCLTLMLPKEVAWPLNGAILAISGLLWALARRLDAGPKHKRTRSNEDQLLLSAQKPRDPAITVFRSAIMLLTCLAILACDFSQFPREHCKTEHYGTRLMDLGIGLMVASSGLVSWRSLATSDWIASLRSSGALLAMGIARSLLVWLSGYHVSVGEYGVHWNFFLTLSLLPLASWLLGRVFGVEWFGLLGLVLMGAYQTVLLVTPLGRFILTDLVVRDNLLRQNKEGIFGMIGKLYLRI